MIIKGKYTSAEIFTENIEDAALQWVEAQCDHPAFDSVKIVQMPDAGEMVHDLLLLVLELHGREFLPGTAPAVLIMLAEGLQTARRGSLYPHQSALHVFLPALVDAHVNNISRHGIGHKDDLPVNAGHRLSLSPDGLHRHAAYYFLFFLSAHRIQIGRQRYENSSTNF